MAGSTSTRVRVDGRLLIAGLLASVLLLALLPVRPATADEHEATVARLFGADRYDTAAKVSQATFPGQRPVALLARGDDPADALAAGALAGLLEAPVLLTRPGSLPSQTRAELARLQVQEVVLLGGPAAISGDVAAELRMLDYRVRRVEGANRFATAARIAAEVPAAERGTVDGRRSVFLANGLNFPDALAAAPASFAGRLPVLLTRPGTLSPEAAQAIRDLAVERVYILGGPGAVSNDVRNAVLGLRTGISAPRLEGTDRTLTAVEIAKFSVDELDFDATNLLVSRGDAPADALAAGPLGGSRRAPMLLTRAADTLGAGLRTHLPEIHEALESVTLLGGPNAITPTVEAQIAALARGEELPREVDDRLLFTSDRDTPAQGPPFALFSIYMREADGRVRRVADGRSVPDYRGYGTVGFADPTWAPNGTRMAATMVEGSSVSIAALSMTGTRLWTVRDAAVPTWAPDGSSVAFAGGPGRGGGTWTVRADGTQPRRILSAGDVASWSPDSRQLATTAEVGGRPVPVVLNRDGTGRRNLPAHPTKGVVEAVWSPDGTELAVTLASPQDGFYWPANEIALLDVDGQGGYRTLVRRGELPVVGAVTWHAGGGRLVFDAGRSTSAFAPSDLYQVNRDGSGFTRLTTTTTSEFSPAFRWPPAS